VGKQPLKCLTSTHKGSYFSTERIHASLLRMESLINSHDDRESMLNVRYKETGPGGARDPWLCEDQRVFGFVRGSCWGLWDERMVGGSNGIRKTELRSSSGFRLPSSSNEAMNPSSGELNTRTESWDSSGAV
jgi:hypothetical protein